MSNNPYQFRQSQYDIIQYDGGLMGVAAVPGAGKTFTLSHLAAALVQKLSTKSVIESQEVLIVTFSNSAVNSFKSRIATILEEERGLLPYTGYRVRTLHGLAHDIVRERPALVGLSEDFQIVDDRQAMRIKQSAIDANLPEWKSRLARYIDPDELENKDKYIHAKALPDMMIGLISNFISRAKEYMWNSYQIQRALENASADFDLIRFAARVYNDYQKSLSYRGAVDFDDLIRLALMALQQDQNFLARLQNRWVYVLEDEAQDSSGLQEQLLSLLTDNRNWVRVGDPNQAINTTFTTANPEFLRDFLEQDDVANRPLNVSGRSSQKILELANELVRWTADNHPIIELRDTFYQQAIRPTSAGDPQTNPPAQASNIFIYPLQQKLTPDKELAVIASSLEKWVPDNPDKTVAVLVPENSRGFKLAERLQALNLPYEELLRSTTQTRQAAYLLTTILRYLADPNQQRNLATVYREVWIPMSWGTVDMPDDEDPSVHIEKGISRLSEVEQLIAPVDESMWDDLFDKMNIAHLPEDWLFDLVDFIRLMQRWLAALELPIDQLVLTVGQDIFKTASDIALGYKIANLLKGLANSNPSWRMTDYVDELRQISDNQRRFLGFDDAESGYEPPKGKITIATMHAAKGLEWDRVYMMAVNNYSFPSAQPHDTYIGERWFIREDLNLDIEAKAQLKALVEGDAEYYQLGNASRWARIEYAAERLRLLYVGITRAKSDLVITWNMGRFWDRDEDSAKVPALPLYHLKQWLQEMDYETTG